MIKKIVPVVLAVIIGLALLPVVQGISSDLTEGAEYTIPVGNMTYLDETEPTISQGTTTLAPIYTQGTASENARIVLDFELTAKHLQGEDFTLRMYYEEFNIALDDPVGKQVDVHHVTRAWVEDEASWNEWADTEAWTVPGGDFEALPVASTDFGAVGWMEWTVAATVGEYEEANFIVKFETESELESPSGAYFVGKDGDPNHQAELIVRMAPQATGVVAGLVTLLPILYILGLIVVVVVVVKARR